MARKTILLLDANYLMSMATSIHHCSCNGATAVPYKLKLIRDAMESKFGHLHKSYLYDAGQLEATDVETAGYVHVQRHDAPAQSKNSSVMALQALEFASSSVNKYDTIVWLGTAAGYRLIQGLRTRLRLATFDSVSDLGHYVNLADPAVWHKMMNSGSTGTEHTPERVAVTHGIIQYFARFMIRLSAAKNTARRITCTTAVAHESQHCDTVNTITIDQEEVSSGMAITSR